MEFLNPSVFYYLFLLAIPVIIHLFNFRKYKKIYFSSTYLLKEIQKKSKSKQQIKQWLILLNRLIITSLIIFAFALPFLKDKQQLQESTKIIIYIDNSFSMSRMDENKNQLINYAKNNSKKIIQKLKTSQKVLILTNDFEKKHQKWYSSKDALTLIDSIQISGNKQSINTAINRYYQFTDTLDFNTLYLFSDFQKTEKLKVIIPHTSNNIKIGLLHTNRETTNTSIDSCYFINPIRKKNTIENLNVRFTNHSNDNIITTAELTINNQQKSNHNLEIPANSTITEKLYYVNPNNTDIVNGVIEIDDTEINFDNKLYFSYSTKEKIPVGIISDNIASDYLKNIFSDSIFQLQDYNINYIEYDKLAIPKLIILDQLLEIPIGLSKVLEQYVKNGKNIFVFLNKNSDLNSYNNFFKSINTDFLANWQQKKNEIELINYNHPIFNSVFNKTSKNIHLPTIDGYFNIKKNNKAQDRNILTFINESPFLSEYIYKRGHIFMCFSDLSINNSFPKHALFVPCLYNAAMMNFTQNNLYQIIQKETIIEKHGLEQNDIVHLKNGNVFDMMPELVFQNQNSIINCQNKIKKDGNYELVVNSERKYPISFNYNRKESQNIFSNKNEIKNLFQNYNIEIIPLYQNSVSETYDENNNEKKIEYFFIISSIILLIIELILLRIWKI